MFSVQHICLLVGTGAEGKEMKQEFRLDGVFIRDLGENAKVKLVCKDCCYRDGYVITEEQEHSIDQPLPQRRCSDCRKLIAWEETAESLGMECREI